MTAMSFAVVATTSQLRRASPPPLSHPKAYFFIRARWFHLHGCFSLPEPTKKWCSVLQGPLSWLSFPLGNCCFLFTFVVAPKAFSCEQRADRDRDSLCGRQAATTNGYTEGMDFFVRLGVIGGTSQIRKFTTNKMCSYTFLFTTDNAFHIIYAIASNSK